MNRGHTADDVDALRTDLHRFVFLLGSSDAQGSLRRTSTVINKHDCKHPPL